MDAVEEELGLLVDYNASEGDGGQDERADDGPGAGHGAPAGEMRAAEGRRPVLRCGDVEQVCMGRTSRSLDPGRPGLVRSERRSREGQFHPYAGMTRIRCKGSPRRRWTSGLSAP